MCIDRGIGQIDIDIDLDTDIHTDTDIHIGIHIDIHKEIYRCRCRNRTGRVGRGVSTRAKKSA